MTIENLKEKSEALFHEIEAFLTAADTDPELCDDETHDELVTIQEAIEAFVGEDALDDN